MSCNRILSSLTRLYRPTSVMPSGTSSFYFGPKRQKLSSFPFVGVDVEPFEVARCAYAI